MFSPWIPLLLPIRQNKNNVGTLVYILISLAFSAFFSGMEIAFISSNKLLFEMDRDERSLSSKVLGMFYRNPNLFISTMLVGNNIALVVYGLQMAIVLDPFIARVVTNEALIVLIQSILSTLLILFVSSFPRPFSRSIRTFRCGCSPCRYSLYISSCSPSPSYRRCSRS